MPKRAHDPEQRFWSKVHIPDDDDACWPWMAGTNEWGYGRFNLGPDAGYEVILAHRYMYLITQGSLVYPNDFVLHTCNNPPCVRPDHLYAGDQSQNMKDAIENGKIGGDRRSKQWLLDKEKSA